MPWPPSPFRRSPELLRTRSLRGECPAQQEASGTVACAPSGWLSDAVTRLPGWVLCVVTWESLCAPMCVHIKCVRVCVCVCECACAQTHRAFPGRHGFALQPVSGTPWALAMAGGASARPPQRPLAEHILFPLISPLLSSPPPPSTSALSSFQNALCRPPHPPSTGAHRAGVAGGFKLGGGDSPGSAREEGVPLRRTLVGHAGPGARPAG